VQEVCDALGGTPLTQAASTLYLSDWYIEPPIAALRALFPDVLHSELLYSPFTLRPSRPFSAAIAAWPMLHSISIQSHQESELASHQHLKAAARTAAELKAGQPFEIVFNAQEDECAFAAAIRNTGGGKVAVRWEVNSSA